MLYTSLILNQESPLKDQQFLKLLGRGSIALAVVSALTSTILTITSFNGVGKKPPEPTRSHSTTPTVSAVTALGRLEPKGEVIHLSAASSLQGAVLVKQLLVTEGDKVRAGQSIAILDNRDSLLAAWEETKQDVNVTQANLAKIMAGAKAGEISAQNAMIARLQEELRGQIAIQQATLARLLAEMEGEKKTQEAKIVRLEAQWRNAKTEFVRYRQLYEQGAIEASKFDSKHLEMETALEQVKEAKAAHNQKITTLQQQIQEAKATHNQKVATLQQQIQEAKANLNRIAEVRPVDVQQAQAEVKRALAALKKAQADLDLTYVRAPVSGQILKVHTKQGETISNQGIVSLGQTDQMIVVAEVYESDIGQVRLGQRAAITSESNTFAGELPGTVTQIGLQIGKKDILNTDPAADVDARVVEVKISVSPVASRRVANLTYSKVVVKIYLESIVHK
jgi:HlyD family secretion protein